MKVSHIVQKPEMGPRCILKGNVYKDRNTGKLYIATNDNYDHTKLICLEDGQMYSLTQFNMTSELIDVTDNVIVKEI